VTGYIYAEHKLSYFEFKATGRELDKTVPFKGRKWTSYRFQLNTQFPTWAHSVTGNSPCRIHLSGHFLRRPVSVTENSPYRIHLSRHFPNWTSSVTENTYRIHLSRHFPNSSPEDWNRSNKKRTLRAIHHGKIPLELTNKMPSTRFINLVSVMEVISQYQHRHSFMEITCEMWKNQR
jgi:hypothetical protein